MLDLRKNNKDLECEILVNGLTSERDLLVAIMAKKIECNIAKATILTLKYLKLVANTAKELQIYNNGSCRLYEE